ncbi:MAG: hypothetical protein WDN28_28450 [Chthoniobacter sp.]
MKGWFTGQQGSEFAPRNYFLPAKLIFLAPTTDCGSISSLTNILWFLIGGDSQDLRRLFTGNWVLPGQLFTCHPQLPEIAYRMIELKSNRRTNHRAATNAAGLSPPPTGVLKRD